MLNRDIEWDKNIIVGAGATSILGYIFMNMKQDDEVIVM